MMSRIYRGKAFIPVWVIGLGMFTMFAPVTIATGTLVLTLGMVAAGIMLVLGRAQTPTIAEVLHRVGGRRPGHS